MYLIKKQLGFAWDHNYLRKLDNSKKEPEQDLI